MYKLFLHFIRTRLDVNKFQPSATLNKTLNLSILLNTLYVLSSLSLCLSLFFKTCIINVDRFMSKSDVGNHFNERDN